MTFGRPRILVVAGHDPGGAGVQADREALGGLAQEVCAVVTAWTEQDEAGVRALGARPVADWEAEARAGLALGLDAIKFGLLPGRAHVHAAAGLVREARERLGAGLPVVVDPVLASSSGGRFLDDEGAREYVRALLPEGVVLTPNLGELAELAGVEAAELVRELEARVVAGRRLLECGARAVVVKGGHGLEDPARDLILDPCGRVRWLEHARIEGGKVRGSGCRFASRLAAGLALGWELERAVREAGEHVLARIRAAGRGA